MKNSSTIKLTVFLIGWVLGTAFVSSCSQKTEKQIDEKTDAIQPKELIPTPFITGDLADPSIVEHGGTYYVFATIDPWGSDSLALFSSSDFKKWERISLNWPTKAQCQTPQSTGNMVWAPGVIKGLDNKYHMFVSVGSEIYAGIADHPAGPWKNVKEDGSPLIPTEKADGIHTIDAEAFIDDDGQAYLYWGSGLTWESESYCMAAKLNPSMTGLTSEPVDITPPHYFEAPYMYKKNGRYFFMYALGKCIDHSYQVRVSVGDSPLGPWTELENSPILATDADSTTIGPGHHTLLEYGEQAYILYHRVRDNNNTLLRELMIDSLNFDQQGNMLNVVPGKGVSNFILN
jgi:beta-xylosidase